MSASLRDLYEQHAIDAAKAFVENTRRGLREHLDRITEVAKVVADLNPASILDAPCGPGVLLDIVSSGVYRPRRVVGLDISETNCHLVRTIYGLEAFCSDLLHYQPAEKFELVMCMELLEHLLNSPIYVKKALSLSSKYVLFSVPVEAGDIDGTFHVRKVHPSELHDWIVSAGGHVEKIWMLNSALCEKPHWIGWLFAIASVDVR